MKPHASAQLQLELGDVAGATRCVPGICCAESCIDCGAELIEHIVCWRRRCSKCQTYPPPDMSIADLEECGAHLQRWLFRVYGPSLGRPWMVP